MTIIYFCSKHVYTSLCLAPVVLKLISLILENPYFFLSNFHEQFNIVS